MSSESLVGRLRARAGRKLEAAGRQPARFADFAQECRREAAFLNAAADEMETLMRDAADARRMLVRMEAGHDN